MEGGTSHEPGPFLRSAPGPGRGGTPMNLDDLRFLRSDRGREVLEALAGEDLAPGRELALLGRLRRTLAPAEAAAALSQARLRLRARGKFPEAERLFLLPEALEQATARPLALHRAEWLHRHAPGGPVLDLGAGLGGDTLALARFRPVVAWEADPLRRELLAANLEELGLADRVEVRGEDWTRAELPEAGAAYADPSRREGGRRRQGLAEMDPPLERVLAVRARVPALAVKVAPGIPDGAVPAGASVEFVGVAGECREAVLWFGPLAGPPRRASVWKDDRWEELVSGGEPPPEGPLEPGCILYEPEPAVLRAGALAELCARLDAWLFDRHLAWLVADRPRPDALVSAFEIQEVHHFGLKRLQERLAALGVARVEIKKRGFAMEPEELRRRLRLPREGRDGVVLLTRRGDEPLFLIARRLRPA